MASTYAGAEEVSRQPYSCQCSVLETVEITMSICTVVIHVDHRLSVNMARHKKAREKNKYGIIFSVLSLSYDYNSVNLNYL
jgi:hypothetical protein